MLPVSSRLRHSRDFTSVVRSGARASASTVVVHLSREAQPTSAVAGFVVGRNVGPATVRNRVRRRLRHLVAERLPRIGAGARLVVRATPAAAGASYARLAGDLDSALARAGRRGSR